MKQEWRTNKSFLGHSYVIHHISIFHVTYLSLIFSISPDLKLAFPVRFEVIRISAKTRFISLFFIFRISFSNFSTFVPTLLDQGKDSCDVENMFALSETHVMRVWTFLSASFIKKKWRFGAEWISRFEMQHRGNFRDETSSFSFLLFEHSTVRAAQTYLWIA